MWGKIYKVIFGAAFIFIIVLLGYSLFFAEEKDIKLITKAAGLFIVYIAYMIRNRKGKKQPVNYEFYEKQYQDIISGAFSEDKRSYKKLLQAIACYNRDEYKKTHRLLESLLKKCTKTRDYSAVYMFQALCFVDEKKYNEAIAAYESLLRYDVTNSRAWSNLGTRYMEQGQMAEAKNAYSNAIMYNPDNAYAYNNLANCYIRLDEAQLALDYAQRALRINEGLYQAMGAVAVASKMLGDEETAEKYCRMYGANGGNIQDLRLRLQQV